MPEESNPAPIPATVPEISVAIGVLFRNLRAPRGVKPDDRMEGYLAALQGFPLDAIEAAVAQILRREVPSIKNPDYCPLAPVLAEIVRAIAPNAVAPRTGQAAKPTRKLFAYRRPNSKVIEAHCTKDWAWQLCRQGIHPAGSIWCPGGLNERPDIGDLYGPDPDWRHAVPWPPPSDKPVEAELRGSNAPMFGMSVRRMHDWSEPQRDEPEPPPPRKVPDYSGDKVEITEQLRKSLEMRAALAKVHDDDSSEGGT